MSTSSSMFELDYKRILSQIISYAIFGGITIFALSFCFLYLSFKVFPDFFETYLDPMYNSGGSRDLFFYMHPIILSGGLAILWFRFRKYLTGNIFTQGIEFGLIYGIVALGPIIWISYSALAVTELTVFSWWIYGTVQACIGGIVFSWLETRKK